MLTGGRGSKARSCLPYAEEHIQALLDERDRAESSVAASRRRAERYPWRSHILVYLGEEGREVAYQAPTRNISVGGLSFLHGYMISPGQEIRLRFPGPGWSTRDVTARGCHCRRLEGRICEVGVRWVNPSLGEDLLEAFVRDDRSRRGQ